MTVTRRIATSILIALGLFSILIWATLFRVVAPWDQVFAHDEVHFLGGDAYYHLRHAGSSLQNFPRLQRQDRWTHYPIGQRAETSGLFDLGLATLALAHPAALKTIAAWYPVGIGLMVFVALFVFVTRLAGTGAGLWACVILLIYPGSFLTRSTLGFADHHVAEVLLAVLTAWGVVTCVTQAPDSRALRGWLPAFAMALPLVLFHFTWVGAPLHLVSVIGVLCLVALVDFWSTGRAPGMARACVRYAFGFLIVFAATSLLVPALVMSPEALPMVTCAALALAFVVAPVLALSERLMVRSGRPRTVVIILICSGAAAFAALMQLPSIETPAARLFEVKTAAVSEHRAVGWDVFLRNFGTAGCLALLAPFALSAAGTLPRRAVVAMIGFTFVFCALWVRTHDYGYLPGPFLAALAALTVDQAYRKLRRSGHRIVFIPVMLAILVVPIYPLVWSRLPWAPASEIRALMTVDAAWSEATRWLRERTPAVSLVNGQPNVRVTGVDHGLPVAYGVWAAWDFGNAIAALAERPVVWSQGVAAHAAKWLVLDKEAASLRQLCHGCRGSERVRYVVLDAATMGRSYTAHAGVAGAAQSDYAVAAGTTRLGDREVRLFDYGPKYAGSVAARLYLDNGRGLGRYRLVFASRQRSLLLYDLGMVDDGGISLRRRTLPLDASSTLQRYREVVDSGRTLVDKRQRRLYYGARIVPSIKIFEQVAGARVTGRAPPGSTVEATLSLNPRDGSGEDVSYLNQTSADADGNYRLLLPYSAGEKATARGTDFIARGPYTVRSLEAPDGSTIATRVLHLGEEQVQTGSAVSLDLVAIHSGQENDDGN